MFELRDRSREVLLFLINLADRFAHERAVLAGLARLVVECLDIGVQVFGFAQDAPQGGNRGSVFVLLGRAADDGRR